ncbi:Dna2-domain-containing protein [Pisolithus orientalis]|uniref:Dna2-domain-containing protein n=1 Tax=Pisolithus orientalis TaxID=936130 RepID=UPI00222518DF|nr:Dna2-domain-containing protein [Pisolithus orientalis]KAI5995328.1 Dna2-domain-containing protein [Pisolithus orientalis]
MENQVKHATVEETDFLNNLLSGLDGAEPVEAKQVARSTGSPTNARRHANTENVDSSKGILDADMLMLLDGAETWDWTDMEADFITPKKHKSRCTRCVVRSIEGDSKFDLHKVLLVKSQPQDNSYTIILRDDWAELDIREGDIVNVLGNFDSNGFIVISSKENLLIHHPDFLLTATALSNAPQCKRKPLLSALVHSSSDVTPSLVWGNILHEVMQTCLLANRWDKAYIDDLIEDAISRNLSELVKIGVTIEEAIREVTLRSKGLRMFSKRYIAEEPKPDAVLTNTRETVNQSSRLAINEILDVEEDIWSPKYGLKGKLDASIQAVIAEITTEKHAKKAPVLSSHPMPLEIKTGRSIAGMEHRAQTMLYTLLSEERYGVEVPSGLLYYTQSEEVVRVPRGRNELRALIIARNEMAGYMTRRAKQSKVQEAFLPPTLDDERICKKCYALDTCMLYRKAVENVEDDSSPIVGIYELKTSHLTPSQAEFFKQWEALITLEEQDAVRFKKELWTMNAQEREEKGRCFGSMVIDPSYVPLQTGSTGKIHRHTYRFVRARDGLVAEDYPSLLNGHMTFGDAISVSVEPELLALARGFILRLSPTEIVVGVDHELSIMKITSRLRALRKTKGRITPLFRIDKDELVSGLGRIRDNLAHLFYAEGDSKRLELVVDLRTPTFGDEQTTLDTLRDVPEYVEATGYLNPSQLGAMARVLSAHDYALILGMPGTGKTTVIAALIRTFVGMGKTVLLTSYTHSAVDTILLKLKDDDFGILRLGNPDKVTSSEISLSLSTKHKFTLSARETATTIEQLENQIMSPPVRNPAAKKAGLEVSLFRRLSEAHPQAVTDLTYQYRMNEDIMQLSNKLIYSNRLRCGSEAVANRSLVLPNRTFIDNLRESGNCLCSDGACWLKHLLDEKCKAIFVDTDQVPAFDSRVGDLVQNEVEGKLVYQIAEALLQCGVSQRQIGIMSLYHQQNKLLSHLLQGKNDIEILTADKSQGRDKDCIIISMVKSNETGQVGDLLKDWRRVNVSFTRAQSKLIIIGSRRTLGTTKLLADFLALMDERKWVLTLQEDAQNLHPSLQPLRKLSLSCSTKRVGENEDIMIENLTVPKKPRTTVARDGILNGRPILKDVLNSD